MSFWRTIQARACRSDCCGRDSAWCSTHPTRPRRARDSVFGDPLETLWKNCIFGLCGVQRLLPSMFGVIVTSTAEQRAAWLNEVTETIDRRFPADGLSCRGEARMRVCAIDHVQLAMPPGGEAQARAFYAGILAWTRSPSRRVGRSRGRVVRQRRGDPPSRRGAGVRTARKAHRPSWSRDWPNW